MGQEQQGEVKWFNDEKGFGFIRASDGGKDWFVHHTSIVMEGRRTLVMGQKVTFEAVEDPKGPKAMNVKPGEVPAETPQ